MNQKVIRVLISLVIFSVCFSLSFLIGDYFYRQNLKHSLSQIKVGMSEKEVIQILGEPDEKKLSDFPGGYIGYKSSVNPLSPNSYYLIEMSSDKKVRKILND